MGTEVESSGMEVRTSPFPRLCFEAVLGVMLKACDLWVSDISQD